MKINISVLSNTLEGNKAIAQEASSNAQNQIDTIRAVASDNTLCSSEAYTRSAEYLETVRIPLLMLHVGFYFAYAEDMQKDITALAELPSDLGGVLDTDVIDQRIELAVAQNRELNEFQEAYSFLLPAVGASIAALIAINDAKIGKFEEIKSKAQEYLNNTDIYASSRSFAESMQQASQSISQVYFNTSTNSYDLSRITNMAWKTVAEEHYWVAHNRLVLMKYFTLDEEGNITGIRIDVSEEDMADLEKILVFIGSALKSGSLESASEFETALTPDMKYILTYLLVSYGDEVLELEKEFAKKALAKGVSPSGILNSLSDIVQGGEIPFFSTFLSFTFVDGKLTSLDVPTSFQANGGFSDIYDYAGKLLAMDIDDKTTVFRYGDKEYRIEAWDGQYVAGALYGGEIGFYSRPLSEAIERPYEDKNLHDYASRIDSLSEHEVDNLFINYDSVQGDDQLSSKMIVSDGQGNEILRNKTKDYIDDGTHYWNFAARKNRGYTKEKLGISGELHFTDPGLAAAAGQALEQDGYAVKVLDENTIEVDWGK